MTKVCSKCGIEKDESKFGWRSAKHEKHDGQCKDCKEAKAKIWRERNPGRRGVTTKRARRKYKQQHPAEYRRHGKRSHLRDRFKMSLEQYEAMELAQDGVCAICGCPETRELNGTCCDLSVDHDHSTGKVRALLCHRCNLMLGYATDLPQRLRKAAAYLEYHGVL